MRYAMYLFLFAGGTEKSCYSVTNWFGKSTIPYYAKNAKIYKKDMNYREVEKTNKVRGKCGNNYDESGLGDVWTERQNILHQMAKIVTAIKQYVAKDEKRGYLLR